jgi:fumarate reductase subunit D
MALVRKTNPRSEVSTSWGVCVNGEHMKVINNLLIILIALLIIAAGLAKVMLTPEKVLFLQSFGLINIVIIALVYFKFWEEFYFLIKKSDCMALS